MNVTREKIIEIDNRFYIMYYIMLLSILTNPIVYYNTNESSNVLIIGMVLIVSLFIFSLGIILSLQNCAANELRSRLFFVFLYCVTGIVIIFTEPNIIVLLSGTGASHATNGWYNFFILICIGSRNLIRSKLIFYIVSIFMISVYFCLLMPNSFSYLQTIVSYIALVVFVNYKAAEIKSGKQDYKIILTGGEGAFERNEEAKTPLDEIIFEIKQEIENIDSLSFGSSPKVQKVYKKLKKLLESILSKIQKNNIYSSRLELITKNMDTENKLYIEQGFFESHGSSINIQPEDLQPKKIVSYNMNELVGILRQIGTEWNFNTFFVSECSNAPIKVIGEYTIKVYRLDEIFNISERTLTGFLSELENNYLDNPYHNACHGADVMCSHVFLVSNSNLKKYMNSIEWLSGIIASLAHDVAHPGKNNRYLVMTKHEYALTYNDISVLEMMHSSLLFKILAKEDNNILKEITGEKLLQIRKLIIEMILATDMGKHFDLVSYIRAKYSEKTEFSNGDTRSDLFKIIIKAADVGHAAKSIDLHQRWCSLVIEEFYAQGDLEKGKGIPVSMFCDRDNTNIGKAQAGFIKNIVLSLYETLGRLLGSEEIEKICIRQLKINLKYWESYQSLRKQTVVEKNENQNIVLSIGNRNERKGSLP